MLHNLSLDAREMTLSTLRMLRPYRMQGVDKVRVGRFFDGGYVMADCLDGIGAAYSLGINDDVSWDLDMASRGVEVFQYDPTIERLPVENPLFHWSPLWIGGERDPAASRETLEGAIEVNGHAERTDLLLKCDIEGSEWPLLQRTPNHVLRQFRQMVFEIHDFAYLTNQADGNNVRRAFDNLTASHRVVHVHGNNFAGWQVIGGVPVPAVLELTLVRKDQGVFTPSDEVFPTALDMPCDSTSADLHIGRFEF